MKPIKNLYINGRFLTQPVTGVQRFALEILNSLDKLLNSKNALKTNYICLVPPDTIQNSFPKWQNISIRACGFMHGNLWEQLELPFHSRNGMLIDLCNIGPLFHFSQIIVIHDASVFTVPQAYSTTFKLKYKLIYYFLSRIAKQVITVSQFSKKELSHYLKIKEDKIAVIPEGCEHILKAEVDESILDQFSLRAQPYLLSVGSSSLHKNLNSVIQAIKLTHEKHPRLVIAGGNFSKIFTQTDNLQDEGFIHLGYVTDGKLRALYENAVAFIFPSLYEGFGLPPLEAMRCGCPVICSNRASIPEICGDAALYFDPTNLSDIRSKIQQLVNEPATQEMFKEKGVLRAQLYTWERAARSLLTNLQNPSFR